MVLGQNIPKAWKIHFTKAKANREPWDTSREEKISAAACRVEVFSPI